MAVTRRVHVFEVYSLASTWGADTLEKAMNAKLHSGERIVDIRWPKPDAGGGHCWVTTEEITMGPIIGCGGLAP